MPLPKADPNKTHTTFELHSLLLQRPPNFHPITSLSDLDPTKFHEFFVPSSEQITSALILQHQKSDFVLAILRTWIQNNSKPLKKTANITGNKGLNHYYDRFEHLRIDQNSELLYFTFYNEGIHSPIPIILICLPLKLL